MTDLTKRFQCQGFSVLPPRGEDWFIGPSPAVVVAATGIRREPEAMCDIGFAKRLKERIKGPEEAHTAIAMASIYPFNVRFENPAEFLQFVERRMTEGLVSRLQPPESKAWLDSSLGSECVRFEETAEDIGVPQFPGTVFIFTMHGFSCLHPNSPSYVIDVYYGQRFLKGQKPLPIEAEVEPFLKSLVFTPIE